MVRGHWVKKDEANRFYVVGTWSFLWCFHILRQEGLSTRRNLLQSSLFWGSPACSNCAEKDKLNKMLNVLVALEALEDGKITLKLEAKDVLPNINCTQASKRAENAVFIPGDFDLLTWPSNSSEQRTKHIFCVNLVQIRSAVPEIFHTQTKNTGWPRQKQNLPQFTACGNNTSFLYMGSLDYIIIFIILVYCPQKWINCEASCACSSDTERLFGSLYYLKC